MSGIHDYATRSSGTVPPDFGEQLRELAVVVADKASIVDAALRQAEDAQLRERDATAHGLLEHQIQKLGHMSAYLWEFHRKVRQSGGREADRVMEREAKILAEYTRVLEPQIQPPIG